MNKETKLMIEKIIDHLVTGTNILIENDDKIFRLMICVRQIELLDIIEDFYNETYVGDRLKDFMSDEIIEPLKSEYHEMALENNKLKRSIYVERLEIFLSNMSMLLKNIDINPV